MPLLLAFYGDDFTGSTDALEWLGRAGVRAVLFLEPPTPESLAPFPGLEALGVAGLTRSLDPEAIRATLVRDLSALRELHPRVVHYKVCSTFDSSPQVGSIGCALETGAGVFDSAIVPILVAAPALGRHCVFGHLFARMGTGASGEVHRLDRHPSMSRHPVTPADESDLRLHLARQTGWPCGLLDVLELQQPSPRVMEKVRTAWDRGDRAMLVDALHDHDLDAVGSLLAALASERDPLFVIGSSGVEMALVRSGMRDEGSVTPPPPPAGPSQRPVVVLSGSCSPVTSAQIDHALANGFAELALETGPLLRTATAATTIAAAAERARDFLAGGRSVVIHTSRGPDDPRQEPLRDLPSETGASPIGETLGRALGEIAGELLSGGSVDRILFAGGDTSSHAARALGFTALEMIATFVPGAPLCRIHAPGTPAHHREVVFKGGQVGDPDLFPRLVHGLPEASP